MLHVCKVIVKQMKLKAAGNIFHLRFNERQKDYVHVWFNFTCSTENKESQDGETCDHFVL